MDKINLIYGEGDVMHTHLNINPFCSEEKPNSIVRSNLINLDEYADDGELDEICALDVLSYLSRKEMVLALRSWISKIKIGGKIIIGGVDFFCVCKNFSKFEMSLEEASFACLGTQEPNYLFRKSFITPIAVSSFLEDNGFSIQKARTDGYNFIVEGIRN